MHGAIVLSPSKTYPDVKITLLLISMTVSLMENSFLKYVGFDDELVCRKCAGKKIKVIEIIQNKFISICESCENEEEIVFIKE